MGEPCAEPRLEEADDEATGLAEGIGRGEENEPAHAMRMTGGQHHRNRASVGVRGDVGFGKMQGVHQGGDAIGGCFQACVEPGNPFRLGPC